MKRSEIFIGKRIFRAIFLLIIISGCTREIYVALQPDYKNNVVLKNEFANIKRTINFSEGEFIDKRSDISKLTMFKQGIYTYNFFAERPIEDAIFEGLATMFTSSGHQWNTIKGGNVKLNLELLSVTANRYTGMINVGAISSIQIKLEFIDADSNSSIYSQVYEGNDERKQALIGLMPMVKKSIDASIINCINNVANDSTLVQILKESNNFVNR